jgi:hypothetical protein
VNIEGLPEKAAQTLDLMYPELVARQRI